MARIFITGSADGLGLLAAKELIQQGHEVVLHARNLQRGNEALRNVPGATGIVNGDLSNIDETKRVAKEVNDMGTFDAVIHNAGVYQVPSKIVFAVNTLAPYILTSLIHKPKRLIYLSSGMHLSGHVNFEGFTINTTTITYADSKLHVVMLSKVMARLWPDVYANALDPGWVPTKMGGKGAPDDLQKGYETQVWLASSNEKEATVSGKYFFHQKERSCNPIANDASLQDEFLKRCERITGVSISL